MGLAVDLRRRHVEPELMDEPGLDPARHRQALRGLERINFWSASPRILWPAVRDLARQVGGRALRVLDIASGAGDVPVGLWTRARRAGLPLELDGWDVSPCAVQYAQRRAAERGAPVRFSVRDALADDIGDGYDVLTCSLFLHHLAEAQAVALLRRMAAAARRLVLVNDLVRGVPGYVLAWVGTRVFSRSPIVHEDGPRSVAAALTPAEALELAARGGLAGARVARRWPCRMLLSWERPSAERNGEAG